MARKSLKPQLNQIRAWVQEGRTDAWIAHQLELSTSELRDFIRRHDLSADEEASDDVDLRDEIEAEIEAAAAQEEALAASEDVEAADELEEAEEAEDDGGESEGRPKPRRRRRRRSGGSGGPKAAELEGTFDHGEEGYGLWLDPAIADLPAYQDGWADRREVVVKVEEDRITIRPA